MRRFASGGSANRDGRFSSNSTVCDRVSAASDRESFREFNLVFSTQYYNIIMFLAVSSIADDSAGRYRLRNYNDTTTDKVSAGAIQQEPHERRTLPANDRQGNVI